MFRDPFTTSKDHTCTKTCINSNEGSTLQFQEKEAVGMMQVLIAAGRAFYYRQIETDSWDTHQSCVCVSKTIKLIAHQVILAVRLLNFVVPVNLRRPCFTAVSPKKVCLQLSKY